MNSASNQAKAETLIKRLRNKFFFQFFLWLKLPVAFWSGVKLESVDLSHAVASVPFKRFTQNPFRSTYFASLAMAAELSTGILSLIAIHAATEKVSMLVIKLEAEYFKKAVSRTFFTCMDGEKISGAIQQTIANSEAVIVTCESTGKNSQGELIAKFYLTWSFKKKS